MGQIFVPVARLPSLLLFPSRPASAARAPQPWMRCPPIRHRNLLSVHAQPQTHPLQIMRGPRLRPLFANLSHCPVPTCPFARHRAPPPLELLNRARRAPWWNSQGHLHLKAELRDAELHSSSRRIASTFPRRMSSSIGAGAHQCPRWGRASLLSLSRTRRKENPTSLGRDWAKSGEPPSQTRRSWPNGVLAFLHKGPPIYL